MANTGGQPTAASDIMGHTRTGISLDQLRQELEAMLEANRREQEGTLRRELDVKLAPLRRGLDHVLDEAMDPWENIKSEKTETVKATSVSNLDPVPAFYGTPKQHYCMVLGKCTHSDIICAHIWPKLTAGRGLNVFDLPAEAVSNPRNFLRLHHAIEKAFDRKRLTFVPAGFFEESTVNLEVKILDPALRSESFSANEMNITMDSLHGKEFHFKFPVDRCPYLRLLAVHATSIQKSEGERVDRRHCGHRRKTKSLRIGPQVFGGRS